MNAKKIFKAVYSAARADREMIRRNMVYTVPGALAAVEAAGSPLWAMRGRDYWAYQRSVALAARLVMDGWQVPNPERRRTAASHGEAPYDFD